MSNYIEFEELESGKVRERYKITTPSGTELFALIAGDNVSAFEQVYGEVPFKGAILTQISDYFIEKAREVMPDVWAIDTGNSLAGNTTLGYYAVPIEAEFILRRYLTGSLWRKVRDGEELPWEDLEMLAKEGVQFHEYQKFDGIIFTPTLKDDEHNDPPISEHDLIERGIIRDLHELWGIQEMCFKVFERGEELAEELGLVLVDTKFEIGRLPETGKLVLIDEVLTLDSSRYWYSSDEAFSASNKPVQVSKESVREDIIKLMVEQELVPPRPSEVEIHRAAPSVKIPEEKFLEWSEAYIRFYKDITGQDFNTENALSCPYAYDILEEYVIDNYAAN
jgi:phosphoribosylaminoimidazole-succinocarboxamide synthase